VKVIKELVVSEKGRNIALDTIVDVFDKGMIILTFPWEEEGGGFAFKSKNLMK